jgi:hypothetical protein
MKCYNLSHTKNCMQNDLQIHLHNFYSTAKQTPVLVSEKASRSKKSRPCDGDRWTTSRSCSRRPKEGRRPPIGTRTRFGGGGRDRGHGAVTGRDDLGQEVGIGGKGLEVGIGGGLPRSPRGRRRNFLAQVTFLSISVPAEK